MATLLTDGLDNPSVRPFASLPYGYNGSDGDDWDRIRIPTAWHPLSTVAAGSGVTCVPAAASKKGRAMVLALSFSADCTFQVTKDDGSTVLWQGPGMKAGVGLIFNLGNGALNPTANNNVKIKSSATADVTGSVGYCYEGV